MRAAVVTQPGGPDVFALREVPDPAFDADEGACRGARLRREPP